VADWVRLHNTGGDSGNAIISMSLCKVLRLFGSGFLGGQVSLRFLIILMSETDCLFQ
jgi:hypothetical protein